MVNLNNIELPYIIKDAILFVPGVHNQTYYDQNEIQSTFKQTNWEDTKIRSLYLDHRDDYAVDPRRPWLGKMMDVGANVRDYAGSVKRVRLDQNKIIGDLHIVDMDTAIKLAYEDSKFAISPAGMFQETRMGNNGSKARKFRLKNFAIVINPAIKQAYIPQSAEHSQQLNWYNFAMQASAEPQPGETLENKCKSFTRKQQPTKMDVDELKDDLIGAVSKEMKSAIEPLATQMGELKKDVEDLKTSKTEEGAAVSPGLPEVDPEEAAKKKKLEEDAKEKEEMKSTISTLQSKMTQMEDEKKQAEDAKAKEVADAEAAKAKDTNKDKEAGAGAEGEKKPEEAGAAAVPAENMDDHANDEGVKLTQASKVDQEMADFICGLGTGI